MITPKRPTPLKRHLTRRDAVEVVSEAEAAPVVVELDTAPVAEVKLEDIATSPVPESQPVEEVVIESPVATLSSELSDTAEAIEELKEAAAKAAMNVQALDKVAEQLAATANEVANILTEDNENNAETAAVETTNEATESAEKPESTIAETASTPAATSAITYHYFYCKSKDGRDITYRRNTASKTYNDEVAALKRSFAARGMTLVKEEIK